MTCSVTHDELNRPLIVRIVTMRVGEGKRRREDGERKDSDPFSEIYDELNHPLMVIV